MQRCTCDLCDSAPGNKFVRKLQRGSAGGYARSVDLDGRGRAAGIDAPVTFCVLLVGG